MINKSIVAVLGVFFILIIDIVQLVRLHYLPYFSKNAAVSQDLKNLVTELAAHQEYALLVDGVLLLIACWGVFRKNLILSNCFAVAFILRGGFLGYDLIYLLILRSQNGSVAVDTVMQGWKWYAWLIFALIAIIDSVCKVIQFPFNFRKKRSGNV